MRSDRVVKGLNISKNSGLCFGSGPKMREMHEFAFEAAEEILSYGVVVRIAFAGHALEEMQFIQTIAVASGGVLDASVTMEDQAL